MRGAQRSELRAARMELAAMQEELAQARQARAELARLQDLRRQARPISAEYLLLTQAFGGLPGSICGVQGQVIVLGVAVAQNRNGNPPRAQAREHL